ncbi:hypothetical protein HN51_046750 [Arachis hypogaea]
MQLALFLHSEGLKLKPKIERSCSSFSKVSRASEQENAVCHEDEALFGDLFSETAHSVGSTNGCEQLGTKNAFGEKKSAELAGSMISSLVEFGELQSVLGLLSQLDAAVDKKASGVLPKAYWECILHGFPCHLSTPSATLLSCALSIRGIICVLDGLFRITAEKKVDLDIEVIRQILDAVMIIKYDRIFEGIHGKCDAVYQSIGAELE